MIHHQNTSKITGKWIHSSMMTESLVMLRNDDSYELSFFFCFTLITFVWFPFVSFKLTLTFKRLISKYTYNFASFFKKDGLGLLPLFLENVFVNVFILLSKTYSRFGFVLSNDYLYFSPNKLRTKVWIFSSIHLHNSSFIGTLNRFLCSSPRSECCMFYMCFSRRCSRH